MDLLPQLGVGRRRREETESAKMGSQDREPSTPALVELVSSSSPAGVEEKKMLSAVPFPKFSGGRWHWYV